MRTFQIIRRGGEVRTYKIFRVGGIEFVSGVSYIVQLAPAAISIVFEDGSYDRLEEVRGYQLVPSRFPLLMGKFHAVRYV